MVFPARRQPVVAVAGVALAALSFVVLASAPPNVALPSAPANNDKDHSSECGAGAHSAAGSAVGASLLQSGVRSERSAPSLDEGSVDDALLQTRVKRAAMAPLPAQAEAPGDAPHTPVREPPEAHALEVFGSTPVGTQSELAPTPYPAPTPSEVHVPAVVHLTHDPHTEADLGELFGDSLEPTIDDEKHHKKHHGYLALVFFFGVLLIGCLILLFLERIMPGVLPYTCALFVAGMLTSLVHQSNTKGSWFHWPPWFHSLDMWQEIDPHMLFYAFLPALLFGEAMRLNVQLALTCLPQVLVLACPGVLLGTGMTALFAKSIFPYGWDWNISMVFGSILSATDPVAVVALFHTLGVSPRLTMLVSGESLLNDGTAIVVFTLVLKLALGAPFDSWAAVMFFGHMTILAIVIGVVVGLLAIALIGFCAEEFHHSDAMVQVIVSICCGYVAFIVGEVEAETSGVITAVSAGFVVALFGWPRFVSRETIKTVWETIEFIANTIIFFLAGVLFANTALDRWGFIGWEDVGWCLVLYVMLTFIRAFMVYLLWIPLNLVGSPLSIQDAVVMIWSGMRGAISLCLAMIVDMEPAINKERGSRIMFHVGGVATLTTLINGTTAPLVLRVLGMTKASQVKERMLSRFAQSLAQRASNEFKQEHASPEECQDVRFHGANEALVREMMRPSGSLGLTQQDVGGAEVISEQALAEIYREMHLKIVQNHYWEAIDAGVLARSLKVARTLLQSIDEALDSTWQGLTDWSILERTLKAEGLENPSSWVRVFSGLAEVRPLAWVPAFRRWFGRDSRAKRMAYMILSFQDAHLHAQLEVPSVCGLEDPLDIQVHQQIRHESALQCERATELLQRLPQEDVEIAKSEMLARKLLHSQIKYLQTMEGKGVLTSIEVEHLESKCLASLKKINTAPKVAWLDAAKAHER